MSTISSSSDAVRAVSVVVVSWNGASFLGDCLDALLAQQAPGWAIRIVVVDNGSTDATVAMVRERYPQVRLVALDRNTGFAAGANRGIAETDAPFVVLVNNDAVCDPGFVAAILAPFDKPDGDRLGAVTGRIVLANSYRPLGGAEADEPGVLVGFDGRRWVPADSTDPRGIELLNSTGGQVTLSGNGRDRDWLSPVAGRATSSDVFGFCGGAAALRRSALDDVGMFDPTLFLYYEDTDLSWRLRRRGWRIEYADDAVVRHRHAASSGTKSEFFLRHNERNRLVVAMRHAPASVVLRAAAHASVHALRDIVRGRNVRRHLQVAGNVLAKLPEILRQRREIERKATVRRAELSQYLVADRSGAFVDHWSKVAKTRR